MTALSIFLRRVVPTAIGASVGALVGWWIGTSAALAVFTVVGTGAGFAFEHMREFVKSRVFTVRFAVPPSVGMLADWLIGEHMRGFVKSRRRVFTIRFAVSTSVGMLAGGMVGGWVGAMVGAACGFACAWMHYLMWSHAIGGFWNHDDNPSPEKRAAIIARVRAREQRDGSPYGSHATLLHKIAETDDAERINRCFGQFAGPRIGRFRAPYHSWFKMGYRVGDFVWRNVDSIEARDSLGASPLHYAARSDSPNSIEALVLHGADIEAQTKEGATPLHLAAFNGSASAIDALIKHGANVNASAYSGETPLDLAAKGDRGHVIAQLLAHGAESGCEEDWDSRLAAHEDWLEEIDSLRERMREMS